MTQRMAFSLGDWQIFPDRNVIVSGDNRQSLEPKVMELLLLLVDADSQVLSRADIEEEIWGQIIVGEDTVARLISKLRRALGDTAQASEYIETISKRGYRLMHSPHQIDSNIPASSPKPQNKPLWIGAGLAIIGLFMATFFVLPNLKSNHSGHPELARADDLYMNFTYTDNETAIKLYEKVLAAESDNADAQSGLANALVQRVIRWPDGKADTLSGTDSLSNALALDLHQTEFGQMTLERAAGLAERSARLSPANPDVLKALGLTYAAQGRLEEAKIVYEKSIELDGMAWESMVNLGEIYQIKGDSSQALNFFMRAYEVMDKSYTSEPQKIGQWQGHLGTVIAQSYLQQAQLEDAEIWFRRVLSISPLDRDASIGLAAILRVNGDKVQAESICQELKSRLTDVVAC